MAAWHRARPRTCAQQRAEQKQSAAKLGYLQWKTSWWEREFERLKSATGLQLDFSGLKRGFLSGEG